MHGIKGILFDDLEPNKTYQVRHWLYVPADLTSHEWDGRVGTLIIVQGRSATPGTKRDRGVYAVQEVFNPGAGGRQFIIVKQDDPTDPPAEVPAAVPEDGAKHEIYEVFLGDGLLPARCDCDAGKAGLPNCKHRDAIAAVVAAGGLPEPEAATGEDDQ
jgi:hypothetical protein